MKLFKRTVTILLSLMIISGAAIYFLAFRKQDVLKVDAKEISQIAELLEKNSIKIDKDIIPRTFPDLPTRRLISATYVPLDFAEAVFGKDFTVVDSRTYTQGSSVLLINNNTFTINLSHLQKDFATAKPEDYGRLIEKTVAEFGLGKSDMSINVNTREGYAEVFKVIDDVVAFDDYFRVDFTSDGIVKLSGRIFNPTGEKTYKKHRALIGIFSEICENKELVGHTVTDITFGYKIGEVNDYTKEVSARPVWRITLDEKVNYDFDM